LNLTQEDLSDKIAEIKTDLMSINKANTGNFDAAILENLINEKSAEKNEKLDKISSVINEYKENIDKATSELNAKSSEALSEISELKILASDVLPHKEAIETISESISGKVFECKETLLWEIDTVKSSLDLITSALAEFNPEYDDSALSLKISEMGNQLSEYSQNYEQAFAVVGSKVNEYLEKVEQISTLTNTKLEDATEEFDDIKSRFDDLSEKLTNLVGNSGLIEILANIRQQFNVIDDQITKEKEGAVSDVKETLDEMLSVINNNLYLIIQNIIQLIFHD
jgi:DNA anti-recombination protein RmuC